MMTDVLDPRSPPADADDSAMLAAVDRAIAEIRRGAAIAITGDDGSHLYALAAEWASAESLDRLAQTGGGPLAVAITGRRARVLGLDDLESGVLILSPRQAQGLSPALVETLSDPCAPETDGHALSALVQAQPRTGMPHPAAAVALAKLARLLPAMVVTPIQTAASIPASVLDVSAAAILAYPSNAAHGLRRVSEARVPLKDAENSRIVAFRPLDGGIEHLAIVIGELDPSQPVLARLHSECFTGDLLGSLRCDCGDQLRGAIAEIAQAGSGVLLYLAQEGRGIGLVNKLRAYQLQDDGFDTLDANLQLGFDDDERIYQPAARMLGLLGITQVRLMTNNPLKVDALAAHGIQVVERVRHVFPANDHNQGYLRTKATRAGHLF